MSTDTRESLEEINSKLQKIIENSYLSKLDMMFSVLISLTIFVTSFMLNSFSSMAGLLRAFLVGFLSLAIYTLTGEFWAILKDDAVKRFAFWLSLLSAISVMGIALPFFSFFLFPPLSILYLIFPFVFMIFLVRLVWQIDGAFLSYSKHLQSRKLEYNRIKLVWQTIAWGYALFTAFLVATLLLFGF